MDPKKLEAPTCQSCGIPLGRKEDQGTNADGTKNREYCIFCFQKGNFTEPDLTMDQMISKVAGVLAGVENMSEEKAKIVADSIIPPLKRWHE